MNKKQRIVIYIAIILIIISFIIEPIPALKSSISEEARMYNMQKIAQTHYIYRIYIPLSILITSSLLIYALRDKSKGLT